MSSEQKFIRTLGILGVIGVFAIIALGLYLNAPIPDDALASDNGRNSTRCMGSTTVSTVVVGNQVSREILATSSNRAWVKVQRPVDTGGIASNTVTLGFDEGAAAVLARGFELATGSPAIEFGLDTDFPYVSSVTAISSNGSTSLRVTQCDYQSAIN